MKNPDVEGAKKLFLNIIGIENTGNTHHGTYYVNGLIRFHSVLKMNKIVQKQI